MVEWKILFLRPLFINNTIELSYCFYYIWWVKLDENGNAEDPYKLLEPVFNDLTVDQLETLVISENSGMRFFWEFIARSFSI